MFTHLKVWETVWTILACITLWQHVEHKTSNTKFLGVTSRQQLVSYYYFLDFNFLNMQSVAYKLNYTST